MSESIINYLKEELNCYEAILSLTKRQRDALINGREDTIEGIIKEKEILIDKVKGIDKNINLEVGSQMKALVKKIESILSEIIEIENECRGIIANTMTTLSNEIKGLDKGRQIARGYSEKGIYTPKFIKTKT